MCTSDVLLQDVAELGTTCESVRVKRIDPPELTRESEGELEIESRPRGRNEREGKRRRETWHSPTVFVRVL